MYEMLLGPEGIERTINGFVWGPIMLTLLVGFGYIMTFWRPAVQKAGLRIQTYHRWGAQGRFQRKRW